MTLSEVDMQVGMDMGYGKKDDRNQGVLINGVDYARSETDERNLHEWPKTRTRPSNFRIFEYFRPQNGTLYIYEVFRRQLVCSKHA